MELTRVSAVIAATVPGHSVVADTIEGLAAQTALERLVEIIVVDAFDPSRAAGAVPQDAPPVRVIAQSGPNHAAALHRGILAARGELVWLVADDFVPLPGALAAHLEARSGQPEPETVTIGPGRFEPPLQRHPFRRWMEHQYDLRRMGFHDTEAERVGFFYAGNTILDRGYYLSTGGFDAAYPYDVVFEQELELRLSRAGMNTVFAGDALALHRHAIRLGERARVMGQAGESCAMLKYHHPEHPALLPDCTMDAAGHLEAAHAARRRFGATRAPRDREAWWRHFLMAAFLHGYTKGWRRIEADRGFSLAGWIREQHVRRDEVSWRVQAGGPDADGLEQFDTGDSLSRIGERDGQPCLLARNPAGAPFVYFRAAPGFTGPDTAVEVEAVVRDDAPGSLWIEYDSTDPDVAVVPDRVGAFKPSPAAVLCGDGAWRTFRFEIPDGRWLTGLVNGGDFRIVRTAKPGEELALSRVALKHRDGARDVGERHSALASPPLNQVIELPATAEPDVSVVIPMYMHTGYTIQCLQAISAHTGGGFEVIVVDDGSPDRPGGWLAAISGLRFVRLDENGGYARACNAGAALSRGRWLVFLNNDTLPQPGWLDALVAEAARHPEAGAIGARLLYPGTGAVQHDGVALDAGGLPFHPRRHQTTAPAAGGECPAVTGACLLTPRDLFEAMSGFDTGYVNGCEDIDYCLRLWEAGRRVRLCRDSTLGHYESVTISRVDRGANERNLRRYRRQWIETGRWRRALNPLIASGFPAAAAQGTPTSVEPTGEAASERDRTVPPTL